MGLAMDADIGRRIAAVGVWRAVRRKDSATKIEEVNMTPLSPLGAGLQIISSWLMSVLALLAVLVSVIFCMVLVECILESATIPPAYAVKTHSSDK